MKHLVLMCAFCLIPACSSSSNGGGGGGGENDASHDTGSGGGDSSTSDSSSNDSSSGGDVEQGDASDGGCPSAWLVAPMTPDSIAVPADGGGVLLHAAGSGTQNYACTQGSDGGISWVFLGPQADLSDCNGTVIGHHYASDAGASSPEWITVDGTYVVAHKVAAYTPDGGAGSVPWLLLQAVGHGGSGTLSQVAYVQRLDTDGGVAPGAGCDAGDMAQVPYTADYWFYGP